MVLEEGMVMGWGSDSGLLLPIAELENEGAIVPANQILGLSLENSVLPVELPQCKLKTLR